MLTTISIKRTAGRARQELEKKRVDREFLKEIYRRYADVPDVELFVQRAEEMFPNLNCGLASVYLQHRLGEGEVVQGKYDQHDHTFLLLADGTTVDITADQYGGPKVYCGPLRQPWSLKEAAVS